MGGGYDGRGAFLEGEIVTHMVYVCVPIQGLKKITTDGVLYWKKILARIICLCVPVQGVEKQRDVKRGSIELGDRSTMKKVSNP